MFGTKRPPKVPEMFANALILGFLLLRVLLHFFFISSFPDPLTILELLEL